MLFGAEFLADGIYRSGHSDTELQIIAVGLSSIIVLSIVTILRTLRKKPARSARTEVDLK
jgi:hypothetical protein